MSCNSNSPMETYASDEGQIISFINKSLISSKALISELYLGTCVLLCLEKVTLPLQPSLTAAQVDIWVIKLTFPVRSVVNIPCEQLWHSVKSL